MEDGGFDEPSGMTFRTTAGTRTAVAVVFTRGSSSDVVGVTPNAKLLASCAVRNVGAQHIPPAVAASGRGVLRVQVLFTRVD